MTKPIVNTKYKVAGRYRLRTSTEDGVETQDTGWFDNLILDQGLDQIGSVSNPPSNPPYLFLASCVGTGSTAPTTADTQLEAWLASVYTSSSATPTVTYVTGAEPYWVCTRTYRFGTGVAAGNLTEVGVGRTVYDGTGLFSRALIVDGGGAPTTLTVTSLEILDITYEYRVYPDVTSTAQVINVNGIDYTFTWNIYQPTTPPTIYAGYVNSGSYDYCNTTIAQFTDGSGGGTFLNPTSSGYSAGSLTRSYTCTFGLSSVYWGTTIGALILITHMHKQIAAISPALPKTNVQYLAVTFSVSWDRFTP